MRKWYCASIQAYILRINLVCFRCSNVLDENISYTPIRVDEETSKKNEGRNKRIFNFERVRGIVRCKNTYKIIDVIKYAGALIIYRVKINKNWLLIFLLDRIYIYIYIHAQPATILSVLLVIRFFRLIARLVGLGKN